MSNPLGSESAGGVLTAQQAPYRPGTAPALGLRAEAMVPPTSSGEEPPHVALVAVAQPPVIHVR
jgi:hypothetical protein